MKWEGLVAAAGVNRKDDHLSQLSFSICTFVDDDARILRWDEGEVIVGRNGKEDGPDQLRIPIDLEINIYVVDWRKIFKENHFHNEKIVPCEYMNV